MAPQAIVIVVTAPVLWLFVWGLAGPWWATGAITASLSIAALGEWDERRERRMRSEWEYPPR